MKLLKQIRRNLINTNILNASSDSCGAFYMGVTRKKLELIFKHKSEFPSKLRPFITAAAASSGDEKPNRVLCQLELEWKRFFSGRDHPDGEWHGVDSTVDTEDQVELALRFFPKILEEFTTTETEPSPIVTPQLALTTSIKAISFVPLFMKLTYEQNNDYALTSFKRNTILKREVLRLLLCNSYPKHAFSWKTSPELDQAALGVLIRIRKEYWVKYWVQEGCWVEYGCLNWLFRQEENYIKPRVRFLYYWNSNRYSVSNWIRDFYDELFEKKKRFELEKIEDPIDLSIFDMMIELRMLRFPGHVHYHLSFLEDACKLFGDERAVETFYEKFSMFLKLYRTINVKKRKRDGDNYKDEETGFCYDKETVFRYGDKRVLNILFRILRSDPVRILNLEQTA